MANTSRLLTLSLISILAASVLHAAPGQRYELKARASEIDPNAKEHPEINFTFTKKDGSPADFQNASVDTSVKLEGKLVIWIMGHNARLFERLNSYGLHAIQVHYANGWFPLFGPLSEKSDGQLLGRVRLEATTGEDHSPDVNIPKADGMKERAFQFVKWLAKKNPEGKWSQFLNDKKDDLRWNKVIISGSSHGATSAARFAKHQAVDRVVMLCGPRDQFEDWQALPSATEPNRYFGFTHVLDSGWTGDHYCRSWELLNLNRYGPVVDVDKVAPPYENSRRLITEADVKNDPNRAHGSVTPGGSAVKDADGNFIHEAVWRYLYTHPVDKVGVPVPPDENCRKDLKSK